MSAHVPSLVALAAAGLRYVLERSPAKFTQRMWERLLCVLLLALSQVAAAASSHSPVPPLNDQSAQVSVECARPHAIRLTGAG